MNEFIEKYKNFMDTGKYNSSLQYMDLFLRQIDIDIALTQGYIEKARRILKIEKPPFIHPRAVQIRADIEHFKDEIKQYRKRKRQLIKLRENPPSKKPNQVIAPLARPMI